MPCQTHGLACGYQVEDPAICPICHATWEKITAPATRIKPNGDIAYLPGYGETPLDHFWRHATTAARRAGVQVAGKRPRKAVA